MNKIDMEKVYASHAVMIYEQAGANFAVAYDAIDGTQEWGNARALTGYELDTVLSDKATLKQFILPDRMRWYEKNQFIMWHAPPVRRGINFSITRRKSTSMKKYSHPGMVFILNRMSLHIVVVGNVKKPSMDDPLYKTPYRGVDVHPANGGVGMCGATKFVPSRDVTYDLSTDGWMEWEESFYESEFNYVPEPRNKMPLTGKTLGDYIENIHS